MRRTPMRRAGEGGGVRDRRSGRPPVGKCELGDDLDHPTARKSLSRRAQRQRAESVHDQCEWLPSRHARLRRAVQQPFAECRQLGARTRLRSRIVTSCGDRQLDRHRDILGGRSESRVSSVYRLESARPLQLPDVERGLAAQWHARLPPVSDPRLEQQLRGDHGSGVSPNCARQ